MSSSVDGTEEILSTTTALAVASANPRSVTADYTTTRAESERMNAATSMTTTTSAGGSIGASVTSFTARSVSSFNEDSSTLPEEVECLLDALVDAIEGAKRGPPLPDRETANLLKGKTVDENMLSEMSRLSKSSGGLTVASQDGTILMEANYDASRGKWSATKAAHSKASMTTARTPTDAAPVLDATSTPETLLREIARLRRQLKLHGAAASTEYADDGSVDLESGCAGAAVEKKGPEDGTNALADEPPRVDYADLRRPGAFRAGGDGGGLDDSGELEGSVRTAPHAPMPEQPVTLTTERSNLMLLEANLVVEPQRVEAKPIRRRRQMMAVVGLMLLSAIAVAVPLAVIFTRHPTPDYKFVTVASQEATFKESLPNKTLDAVALRPSPQAMAYEWLFGSGDHPVLPDEESVTRMVHRFALVTLFFATGGNDTWRSGKGWLDKSEHECLWEGVSCGNDTVDQFSFCKKDFRLPNSVSCRLQNDAQIASLDLAGRGLSGQLPDEIGLLSTASLRTLILQGNDLSGTVPSGIGNLTTLQSLSLRQNRCTGSLPTAFWNLKKLYALDLSGNSLTGTIPPEIGQLDLLEDFLAGKNYLSGSLPPNFSALTNMVQLDLSDNILSTNFPPEVVRLTNLMSLDLSSNWVDGAIPTDIGDLVSLVALDLAGTQLTGSIPTEIGRLHSLEFWNTGSNALTWNLPTEIGLCTALLEFESTGNRHTGTIPTEIGNLKNLGTWMTDYNALTGPIPSELRLLTGLEYLYVGSNAHTGRIPTEIGLLKRLLTLFATGNSISGSLPTEIGSCLQLTSLQVSGNQLEGRIPSEVSQLVNLAELVVSDNQFTGTLQMELGHLTNLVTLSLGGNALTGPLPPAIYSLAKLTDLTLSDTRFEGSTMPTRLSTLSNLKLFYLHNSSLSGTIPTELGNLKQLLYIDLGANQLSGTIPTELGWLSSVRKIVLSHNRLSGTVPTEPSRLTSLWTLKLQQNELTGSIPPELAGTPDLRELRLEGNRLGGVVPNQFCPLMVDPCSDPDTDDITCSQRAPLNLTIDCALVNCTCKRSSCTCIAPPSSTGAWYDDDDDSNFL